jgi:hypothetical protein
MNYSYNMTKLKNYILFCFISLFISVAHSQMTLNDKLKAHLAEYAVNFDFMLGSKGISTYSSEEPKLELIVEVSQKYGESSAVLFYHHKEDTLHIWLIRGASWYRNGLFYGFSLVNQKDLLEYEYSFKEAIRKGVVSFNRGAQSSSNKEDKNFSFDELNDILFPETIKSEMSGMNKLLVVPALNISSIPLYLLDPFERGRYLIDDFTISFVHGFEHVFQNHWSENYASKLFLNYDLIGYSNFENCDEWIDLPGVEKEIELVDSIIVMNRQILLDSLKHFGYYGSKLPYIFKKLNELSAKSFVEGNLNRRKSDRVVYIASHATSSSEDPLRNNYILTNTCERITEGEIQFMDNEGVLLVVLSACETGTGKSMETGTLSVTRAFLKSGAMNAVSSLWSVNDEATAEFMRIFFDELTHSEWSKLVYMEDVKGYRNDYDFGFNVQFYPALQLRNAMLKFREVDPDPNHWAAFASMGFPIIYLTF